MRKGLITDLLLSTAMAAMIKLVYQECTGIENLIIFIMLFLTFRIFRIFRLEDKINDK